MKQHRSTSISFILSLVLLISFQTNGFTQNAPKNLKVISYNIWNGFDWGKDTDRKKQFIIWAKSQHSNVLALQELCGYTQEKLLKEAKQWGHSYSEIVKTSGHPVGITSNKPIEVKEKILENMHHGALHCKIDGIDYIVVHFSPFSYQKRSEEVKIISEKLATFDRDQEKYIVLGDFNAVSPFDADLYKNNDSLMNSMRASELKHDYVRNLLHGELEYGVMSAILGYPLLDAVQKYTTDWDDRISFPTQVFETEKGEGRSINSKRIDYILMSPFLSQKCVSSKVLNQKDTYYLSDHYPVMAEFKF